MFLILFFFSIGFISSFEIPVFKVSSPSHYEAHREIGIHFRSRIKEFLTRYRTLNNTLLPFYKEHFDQYENWRKTIQEQYPKIYDEIRGLSDGCLVSFHIIMLLQMTTEIVQFTNSNYPSQRGDDHCTDIALQTNEASIRGHNEDGDEMNKYYAYFVDVEITEESKERIFSYCYPGVIPGTAFGFNGEGLIFSGNDLFPSTVRLGSTIPNTIVYRLSMSGKTIMDSILILSMISNRAYGNNINIGSIHTKEQMSIELSPDQSSVLQHSGETNSSHVNVYKVLKDVDFIHDESSIHRQNRIDEFPKWENEKQILEILGDTKDNEFPIYRTSKISTLCTVFFDLNQKIAKIWTDNPKSTDPVQKFDLTTLSDLEK